MLVGGGVAGGALLDQEAAHAVVGLRPDHRHVGQGAVGDPLLRAVEHPGVAVACRAVVQHAAGVGAEVGLGQAEAADRLGRGELRDPAVLLLLGAEGVDRVHDQRALHRHEAAQPRVAALQLLHDQAVGDVAQAGQAVLVDVGAEQAELGHLGHQVHREARLLVALLDDGHHLVVDEGAHAFADHALLFGERESMSRKSTPGKRLMRFLLRDLVASGLGATGPGAAGFVSRGRGETEDGRACRSVGMASYHVGPAIRDAWRRAPLPLPSPGVMTPVPTAVPSDPGSAA